MKKKIVSLVLALLMLASLLPAAAFADSKKEDYKVLSIGDSTSNGYCLNDYGKYSSAIWCPKSYHHSGLGFMDYASRYSTGYRMADYLTKTLTDKNIIFESLTFEGMRTDELRALLDESYTGDYFCYPDHMPNYEKMFAGDEGKGFGGYKADHDVGDAQDIHEFFRQEISDADLIIMDCCTNNFGTYTSDRLMGYHGGQLDETVLDAIDSIAPGFKETVQGTINNYFDFLYDLLPEGMIQELFDTFTYAFVDMCINFSVDVDTILKLNPDVKLIAVGPFNVMRGITVEYDGITIDFGAVWGAMINLANIYMTTLDPNRDRFYFANVMDSVELLVDDVAHGEFTNIYVETLEEYFGTINDEILELVVQAANMTSIDLGAILDVINTDLKNSGKAAVQKALNEGWEALDASEQSFLYVFFRFIVNASGTHPSADGYATKFRAVREAYNSRISASGKYLEVLAETGRQAAVGLSTSLTAPLINAFKKFFSIDLTRTINAAVDFVSKAIVRRIL